jgi:hypothetical protein
MAETTGALRPKKERAIQNGNQNVEDLDRRFREVPDWGLPIRSTAAPTKQRSFG